MIPRPRIDQACLKKAPLPSKGRGRGLGRRLRSARWPAPERAGGNVHVADPEGRMSWTERSTHMFLDSQCPTCTLWLHWTNFAEPYTSRTHAHSADEIIVVLRGEMRLGRRALTPGGA